MWYVYFVELSNGDIYVGSADDLRRRFASHQNGHVVSTRDYLPAVLRSYVAVTDELTARRLERYFKSAPARLSRRSDFWRCGCQPTTHEKSGARWVATTLRMLLLPLL